MKTTAEPKEGDLRVWWIPQMPMDPFHYPVPDYMTGLHLQNALALYDLFQFENNVKPDYSNTGGMEVFERGEWTEWENDEGQQSDELLNEPPFCEPHQDLD